MHEAINIACPSTGTSAAIVPTLGFNCIEFSTVFAGKLVDVIDSEEGFLSGILRPTRSGIPILFPFPNRIKDGRFSWDGKDYSIPIPAGRNHAMHGFCYDRPWRVIHKTPSELTGEFQLSVDASDARQQWPADFRIRVTYKVEPHKLICVFEIHNPDTLPLPWGLGTHSYFKVPLTGDSTPGNCLIKLPLATQYVNDGELPTGETQETELANHLSEGEYFDVLKLDNLFAHKPLPLIETSILDETSGLQMTQSFSQDFPYNVMFTPPGRNCICMEPYTCITDAVNMQSKDIPTGWKTLPPGQSTLLQIDIEISKIIA